MAYFLICKIKFPLFQFSGVWIPQWTSILFNKLSQKNPFCINLNIGDKLESESIRSDQSRSSAPRITSSLLGPGRCLAEFRVEEKILKNKFLVGIKVKRTFSDSIIFRVKISCFYFYCSVNKNCELLIWKRVVLIFGWARFMFLDESELKFLHPWNGKWTKYQQWAQCGRPFPPQCPDQTPHGKGKKIRLEISF